VLIEDKVMLSVVFLECQSPKPRTTDRDSCKNKRDADTIPHARIEIEEGEDIKLNKNGKNKPRTDVNEAFNKAFHAWPRCR